MDEDQFMKLAESTPQLGVILVTYNSSDVILDCLESLLASQKVNLRVAIVDNDSNDGTPQLIRRWAEGKENAPLANLPVDIGNIKKPVTIGNNFSAEDSKHSVVLFETGENLGFAGGVNFGMKMLSALPSVDKFWILNPDTVVPKFTAHCFATFGANDDDFSLLGGRVLYVDKPDMLQIDGGTINWHTGITGNLNLFRKITETRPPSSSDIDFVTGASMVVSRQFYEIVGPMKEDYFLYYEEVDWAMRRGNLSLAICPEALVYHRAGSSIGSASLGRPASPFSLYFKHRSRIMFLRRFRPRSVPIGLSWSLLKAGQLVAKGWRKEASALLAGSFGKGPPEEVRKILSDKVLKKLKLENN